MPLPKMTKVHRMFLYGVLTTVAVALCIVVLTFAIIFVKSRGIGPAPVAPAPAMAAPGAVKTISPSQVKVVSGSVTSVNSRTITINTSGVDRTLSITSDTIVLLPSAVAKNPLQHEQFDVTVIPTGTLVHITLKPGTDDIAADITITSKI